MPRVCWPLQNGRPSVPIRLIMPNRVSIVNRTLLADTGAGSSQSGYELILSEGDCRRFGRRQTRRVGLRGAYTGIFFLYLVRIEIPLLSFDQEVAVVSVPAMQLPAGFDGLAAFSFLNRFTYGNFGDTNRFCLET
jgi:hypothetical protein